MMTIINMLGIIFLLVLIVPFLELLYANRKTSNKNEANYVSEQGLLDFDLNELKIECTDNQNPARIGHRTILSKDALEIRKREEYSKKLP